MFQRLALVSIIFASIRSGCSKQNFSRCEYNGDMCKVDLENCIRKMREEKVFIVRCYGLNYGSGMLYDDRQDIANFHITITKNERQYYPDLLTYTIVRKTGPRTNWSEPKSVSKIDDCCSMKENDTCALPMKGPDDHLYALFPLKQNDDDEWYCQYPLHESIPVLKELKWCKSEDDIACAVYERGNVLVKTVSEPLSFAEMNKTIDYCYFSVAEKYLAPNGENSFTAANITAANVSGDGIFAQLSGGETRTCDLKKGIKGDHAEDISEEYYEKSSDFVCYFIRVLNNYWMSQPHCLNVTARIDGKANGENSGTIIVISVVLACVVVLAVIIFLVRCFKNDQQKITFKMPFAQIVYNNVERTEANNAQPMKEIVDEITFSAINHTGPEVDALEVEETGGLTLNTAEEVAIPLCHEDQSVGQSRPSVHTGPEVDALEVEETGGLTLNTAEEVATPLCHEDQSAGQSRPSGFTENNGMTNNGYVDKDSLISPQYVKKDCL